MSSSSTGTPKLLLPTHNGHQSPHSKSPIRPGWSMLASLGPLCTAVAVLAARLFRRGATPSVCHAMQSIIEGRHCTVIPDPPGNCSLLSVLADCPLELFQNFDFSICISLLFRHFRCRTVIFNHNVRVFVLYRTPPLGYCRLPPPPGRL